MTGKSMTEEGGLWQPVWGTGGFSHSLLLPLRIPSITPQYCDQVLQLQHLLLRAAAKARAFDRNIFQITKLLLGSLLPVSGLALPVIFPIKCPRYASKDSDCHSLRHWQENAPD